MKLSSAMFRTPVKFDLRNGFEMQYIKKFKHTFTGIFRLWYIFYECTD